jgi:hypothetical protein
VIREIALNIGRVLMLAILLVVTSRFSIATSFIVAAVASFGVTLLAKYRAKIP